MTLPIDPLVAEAVRCLNEAQREAFEERAAIIEYEAGYGRDHAECLALLNILLRYSPGLVLVEMTRHGKTTWLLTTDVAALSRRLAVPVTQSRDAVEIIKQQFQNAALLQPFK